jgi:hypothetical protein
MKRLTLTVAVLLLSGCSILTTRYQRRGVEEGLDPISLTEFEKRSAITAQINMEARSVEEFRDPSFHVGIIEFTEEGFVNTAQKNQVMTMVNETIDHAPNGTIMVVFAHGWHHSCRTCDDNLTCFRRVLNALAKDEENGKHRKVVGVYLAWRARVFGLDAPDYATIWNRKPVAERIGRTGAKEVLFELHEKWAAHAGVNALQPVIMVSVGHSLGGAMLLSAIRGKLTGNIDDIVHPNHTGIFRVIRAQGVRRPNDKQKALRARFGDLVVLVNPAVEAARYGEFDNDLKDARLPLMKEKELLDRGMPPDKELPYSDRQLPIMLTISSTNTADWPNGILFPISRVFTVFNVFGTPALPRWSELAALGHYGASITHTLHFDDKGSRINEREAEACGCAGNWDSQITSPEKFNLSAATQTLAVAGAVTPMKYLFKLAPGRDCEDGTKGCRGWDEHSPFVVIGTDKTVIKGHNDIFNPVFVGFLRMYVRAIEEEQFKGGMTRTQSAY